MRFRRCEGRACSSAETMLDPGGQFAFMAPQLFLVDGHSHCYKAFYALRNMTSAGGAPTNMVFGFASMLRKAIKDYAPDYLAVAFDRRGPTFRHKMYDQYKANRVAPPPEFSAQVPVVHELLEAWRVPVFEMDGYEADDLLGALTRQARAQGVEVTLLTSDKDAEQLLGPGVAILDMQKGTRITAESLSAEKGIRPEQVVDVLALAGDASDNVPGVPKVGLKTALELVTTHGGVEAVLAAAKDMKKSKLRENLLASADIARLSLRLVTIDVNAPVQLDLEACRVRPPDEDRLRALYERLGFRQFLSEMPAVRTKEEKRYTLVDTPEALEAFLSALKKQKRFAVDTETTSPRPAEAALVGVSVSWEAGAAFYVPFRGPLGSRVMDLGRTMDALRPVFGDPAIAKIGQNIKYDAIVLERHGAPLRGIVFDTMIAAWLLNPESRGFGLDALAFSLLNYQGIPISELIGKGAKQITMDLVPVDRVCEYACEDADLTWRVGQVLEPRLREAGLEPLFRDIELPLIDVLARMEMNGVRLDPRPLAEMSVSLARRIEELEKEIQRQAGVEFNPASPKQLGEVLFDTLSLPAGRRGKTGRSTDSEVLQQLLPLHPVPGLVLEYRQALKLKNTYADALPEMVSPRTGKLHTSFSQTATATGRLSSSDPNLQNIPIRTEMGSEIRRAFVPSEPGWVFVSADYSQIELRILAHLSKDQDLCEAFRKDEDIHRFVAAQVFGLAPGDISDSQRRAAKAVNFGIIYGLTAYGLSKDIGVPVKEADAFIASYF